MKNEDRKSILKEAKALAVAMPRQVGVSSTRPLAISEKRPWVSLGMGVHPLQVKKLNAEVRAAGITGVRYLPNGKCEVTSRSARRREMERRGIADADAGYGDRAPQNY